jgi:hypothetical protein
MIHIDQSDIQDLNYIKIDSLKDIVRMQLKPFNCVDIKGNKFMIIERLYTIQEAYGYDLWYYLLFNINQSKKLYILFVDDLREEKMTVK